MQGICCSQSLFFFQITKTEWAIGTDPDGSEDIQNFTVIESGDFVMKTNLKLQNKKTYYVTMRCTNAAKLVSTLVSGGNKKFYMIYIVMIISHTIDINSY